MGAGDTTDYIRQHLTFAGRSDPPFSDDASHAIHLASRGYPRAVNNLAVAALIVTYAGPAHETESAHGKRSRACGAFSRPTIVTGHDAAIVQRRDGQHVLRTKVTDDRTFV